MRSWHSVAFLTVSLLLGMTSVIAQGLVTQPFPQPYPSVSFQYQRPDFKTSRAFLHHFLTRRKDCKDDTLLGVVVELFASEGIHLCPATDFAPEVIMFDPLYKITEGAENAAVEAVTQWRFASR